MPRPHPRARSRRAAGPAVAATLVTAMLMPLPASAEPEAPSALLTGELVLVADAHRTSEPSDHADEVAAHVRLPGGLVVPVDAHAVEGTASGSRVTLEVPVPAPVVAAVEDGRRVAVPADGAPPTATGAPAVERTTIPPAALAAAESAPAPATSDLAGATALVLATTGTAGEGELVAATAPAAVAATGAPRRVTAVVVTQQGRSDARYTDAEVSRIIAAGSDFWADQSGGSVTFAQEGATVRYASSLSCAQPFPLWEEAAARAGWTWEPDSHLVLFLPGGGGCSYGLGTVGGGPSAGGYSYVSDTSWPALAHEWGHNMSLQHADRALCGAAADARSCTEQAYGDLPDVMSSTSTPHAAGNASAIALGRLGLLPAADRVAITGTGVSTVTLQPLSDLVGVRSATVVDPRSGTTYYLENRQSAGRDTYGWAGRSGQTFGLRVMRTGTGSKTLVLDASPTNGTDPDVVVKPGATFSSAAGGVQVRTRLGEAGAVVASVSVAPTGAAHWLTGPFATAVAPAAAPRSALVGTTLTLAGRVTGPAGRTPTGTVTATSPAGATASSAVRADGTYSLAWTPTVLGRATVTLTYASDHVAYLTSAKDVLVPVVAPTQTSATSPSTTLAAGALAALPVSVTAPGHAGVVPAGTVSVSEGTRRLASAVLVRGAATVKLPVLVGGRHDLAVAFTPATPTTGPTTAASTTSAVVTVAPATPTVTATLAATDVATTETGRVAVVVTAPSGVVPAGTVAVREGSTTLATATLASGRATVVLPRLPVGMHDLVVAYGGEVRALPAQSAPVRLEVTTLPRSRVTATVAGVTTAQQPVVVVRALSTLGAGTGEVTVSRGGAVVARGALVSGAARITLPLQPAGTAPLVVRHVGGPTVEGGVASPSLVVAKSTPTVTTTLSATTKRAAATATMTVVVTSPAGTPTGTVQLRSGAAVLGTATLAGGSATLTVPSTLPVGSRSLTAVYSGSTELLTRTSAASTITVTS